MKINNLLVGFLVIIINNPLYACEIVNKRDVHLADRKGVAGRCSNNGENIECYVGDEYSGGFTCEGPTGTISSPNLKSLIYTTCGCSPTDQEAIERQMEQELE